MKQVQPANLEAGEAYKKLLQTRFTCKRYDPDKAVSDEAFHLILEAAQLSPSSFGLEPWKILVLDSPELVEEVRAQAWGSKRNADRTIVMLSKKGLKPTSPYAQHIHDDVKYLDSDAKAKIQQVISAFQTNDQKFTTPEALDAWAQRQTYIALANMLNMAATLGVDATPIEGFNLDGLTQILVELKLLDPAEWRVTYLAQFGYASADHMAHHQTRRPLSEVVTFASSKN